MNRSFVGTASKLDCGTSKFLARTSLGVCESQSVIRNVWNSSKFPSSKHEEELAPIRAQALNRMRHTRGEQPQVAPTYIADKTPAFLIYGGDARTAVEHDGPF